MEKMETIKQVLMRRDKMTAGEALELINEARKAWEAGEYEDPEELLEDWFGLEPDYLFDEDLGIF